MSQSSIPTPPPLRFPDAVRADLEAHGVGFAAETERMMSAHVQPCIAVTARRVSKRPLYRNPLLRLLGGRTAEPVLSVTASKFGGIPYCERGESWKGYSFLGQIDLAQATAVLPSNASKLSGLLRIDVGSSILDVRVRWFPEVEPARACYPMVPSVGNWEAQLNFELGWTIPEGNALEAIWPLHDILWFEYDEFFPAGYNADGWNEFHRMLGHKPSGLDEYYEFEPLPRYTDDISAYENLLRLTFDNTAGFDWGTNWIYLVVPREDLHRGDLSRVVTLVANS